MRGDQSGGRNRAALHYRRFRPAEDVKKTKEERNPFRLGCFGSVGVFFSVHFDRFAVVVVVVVVVFFLYTALFRCGANTIRRNSTNSGGWFSKWRHTIPSPVGPLTV